ncbi:hypothetical protein HBA54_04530 [Pelagibius litoralis]|uniref:Uncharacterized protein n=1 Tax=Pelagibius litoralis TaxID=374515 RepID=A0A967EX59_9PROT|nr:hypothetical protein [Pelagibius litoralis]NIA67850.1 hypothetical protein [Pelagibius litoralis]
MARFWIVPAALALGLAVTACSGVTMKPGDQLRNNREIRPGPGFLTGPEGEFVIFRVEGEEAAAQADPQAGSENHTASE